MPARKAPLRAVTEADKPAAPAKRLTVVEAAASGDHRALLVAMRERIARTITDADCPPRDLASLTRRLQDIAKEIESLDVRAKEEARDNDPTADEEWDAEAL